MLVMRDFTLRFEEEQPVPDSTRVSVFHVELLQLSPEKGSAVMSSTRRCVPCTPAVHRCREKCTEPVRAWPDPVTSLRRVT